VLNALRAHDDRFNATINKIELNKNKPNNILIGRPARADDDGSWVASETSTGYAKQLEIQFQELKSMIYAKMVLKVGNKRYWENWAKDVASIAQRQIERITNLVEKNPRYQQVFDNFLKGLHKNINPSVSQSEAIEMLSQHIITRPVFDALFENYSFVKNNPVSQSMQSMLDILEEQSFEKETRPLEKFYESVKTRASGIDNAEGKQRIIIELYEKFFKTTFPKVLERLGIAYTPVEVVDFIIHSVNDILIKEFGRTVSDENVHLLDPFAGTGTFIVRLLQSGLIHKKDLLRKYKNEIHANEILLLAYYLAAVNIENAFHDLAGKDSSYMPFEGICLTDTFQLGESQDGEKLFSEMFPQNSKRVQRQQKAPLRVIMGNPPYSIGQKSANDDAANQSYPKLDSRIADAYAKQSTAGLNKSLYDAYIKAFRWSTDRLDKTGGIICFVSNGGWIDGNSTDGFRKTLEKEFTAIYVFNLRGNARASGELRQKEGGGVFGGGSRTPIAITLLVKKPEIKTDKAIIYYHDIGDYLDRKDKLKIISDFKTFANENLPLKLLQPDERGDWISMRNERFLKYFNIGDKNEESETSIFNPIYSMGLATARDAWVYNFSLEILKSNIKKTIAHYNDQRLLITKNQQPEPIKDAVLGNWTRDWLNHLKKNNTIVEDNAEYRKALYRPFTKVNSYFADNLNQERYQMPKLFPAPALNNILICVSGVGTTKEFSTLITKAVPDLQLLANAQCFPLYYYEKKDVPKMDFYDGVEQQDYIRRDAVSDFILDKAKKQYGENVTKEDIFYYVYGFLHSKEYRVAFANDFKKMLPRLPLLKEAKDFWAFSKAGRALAELHLNYESVPPFEGAEVVHTPLTISETMKSLSQGEIKYADYEVQKMQFPKKDQKDTIIYNSRISVCKIPLKAYEYVVNGKSAIEWVMERYKVTPYKESNIVNNPNDWAKETGNPKYILDLLLSIINVSVQTAEIVERLPKAEFE
ncbi:MAG: helicase, partial [Candidatus Nephrothrix sp. EaCA]